MKKMFAAMAVMVALAGNLFAGDPMIMIKQKAKDASNKNNEQQGVPPSYPASTPPPASGGSATKPAPSTPAPQQLTAEQAALARLVADLGAVKAEDGDKLTTDLMAMARGANKPSATAVRKLAGDLAAALAGKTISAAQRSRLAQNLQAVLGGAKVSPTQMDDIIADVPAILKKVGADAKATAAVGDDLKAVATEIKKK